MRTYSFLEFLELPYQQNEIHNSEDFVFIYTDIESVIKTLENNVCISKIKIPIIQRDYAQGREDKKELREEFVDDLFKALESNKELKLDFIYGSVKDNNVFLPLDGQQRLTTLFLLHWFLIKSEAEDKNQHRDLLFKFSYETRDTARKFFNQLVDFNFHENPKKSIMKSYWFKNNYVLDPTIFSSLNMLETIYERYSKSDFKGSLLSRLDIIKFYVLPMHNFNLTDDLYIKLNARGKVLSPYENMKADLIGWVTELKTYKDNLNDLKSNELTKLESLANKFDNIWSTLFWNMVNHFEEQTEVLDAKPIDSHLFRFIHRLIINEYIMDYKGSEILKDEVYNRLLQKENDLLYSNLDFYKKNELISEKFICKLETLLDYWVKEDNKSLICQTLTPSWNSDFKWNLIKEKYTMEDRMLLDALNQYILFNNDSNFNEERFKEWIRIIWNLIADPDIRSIEASKTAMSVIRNISKFSSDIYSNLINNQINEYISSLKNIHKAQLEEEQLKAIKIREVPENLGWKEAIIKCESHKLFSGNIGFLLIDIENFEQLISRFHIASKLFNDKGANELLPNQNHSLMRCQISEIKTWNFLEKFNFSDNEINWKTYLRRNKLVKRVIGQLVTFSAIDEVKTFISKCLTRESIFNDEARKQLVHQNLYKYNEFHKWIQQERVNKIKWLGYHYFAIRPSAWYSKVMLDCYRNEIISELIALFKIDIMNNHKCKDSNFFLGESVEIQKTIGQTKISFQFDNNKNLTIGLKKEYNSHLNSNVPEVDKKQIFFKLDENGELCIHFAKKIEDLTQETETVDDNWFIKYTFDYTSVQVKEQILPFLQKIKDSILIKDSVLENI